MIFDTDILSMLGKIGRADLLRKLFPESDLLISFEVYNELLRAKEAGYDFVDEVLKHGFNIIYLDSDLINEFKQNKEELRNIHPGELTSILLCKQKGMDFATNDTKAKRFCEEVGIDWIDIVDIFRLCYLKDILERSEIETLISEIEISDRTRIKKIERIFADKDVKVGQKRQKK
jgi:predicted nucleic acid-binding protein